MPSWLNVEEVPNPGPLNMARDVSLLEAAEAGSPGARLYTWDGPWVSLGRFQQPSRDLLRPGTTASVIRPTGGKAVLHGHDLTVGLAVPLAALGLGPRELKATYRMVIAPIVAGLQGAGLDARLAEDTRHLSRGPRTADCFAFSSANDVVDAETGLKLCGCALRLTDRAVLVQASLPNGEPLVDPRTVIREGVALRSPAWDVSAFAEAFGNALERLL